MKIPFSFLPPGIVFPIAKRFIALGNTLTNFLPTLRSELSQAGIELSPREYASVSIVVGFLNGLLITLLIALLGFLLVNPSVILMGAGFGFIVGIGSFATVILYPIIIAKRRTRRIDAQLIPALRQLLIEMRAGVSLFRAMTSISSGYGEVSLEFKKIVKEINAGVPEWDALADASTRNPSLKFRRVLWQISNGLKVGSDIGNVIEGMINELTRERIDEIWKYGQELSPWTMLYMLGAVVVPSLGVTMVIVIMSFLNIVIPKMIFPAVLLGLLLFQLFFISFIRSRRPTVE